MPEKPKGLGEAEERALRELLRSYRNRPVNSTQRPDFTTQSVTNETSTTPDVYLAVTPEGGLPGGDYTGSGSGTAGETPYFLTGVECQIYDVDEGTGEVQEVDQLLHIVYNVSEVDIAGNEWVIIQRDKYGRWLVASVPGSAVSPDEDYFPEPSGGPCVVWYTSYLHLASVAVHPGQVLAPGQFLGRLGAHPGGAHLHFSLGDGVQDQNPGPGTVTAGVAVDIETWLVVLDPPVPVVGPHVGVPPSPPDHFTFDELLTIRANFALPLDPSLDWTAYVLSAAHTGWDYYAIDFAVAPLSDQEEVGLAVYAGFSGPFVLTTVQFVGFTEGVGWVVILRHQIGECPDPGTGTGTPEEDTYGTYLGCGLSFDGQFRIKLDLTDVVFDGLYWDNSLCALGVLIDCGLTYVGSAIGVDNVALTGDRSLSSMVPGPDCEVHFDQESAFQVAVEYVVGPAPTIYRSGTSVVFSANVQTIVDHFNAAGVVIDRVYGEVESVETSVELCAPECCDPQYELGVEVDGYRDSGRTVEYRSLVGLGPTEFFFTALVVGGLGPYTYDWDFGDGTGSADGPDVSHEFDEYGLYLVRVTVRDECGYVASSTFPVRIVDEVPCDECENCLRGMPWAYTVLVAGGTGNFVQFNGRWMVPWNDPICTFGLSVHDPLVPGFDVISVGIVVSESGLFEVNFSSLDGTFAEYASGTDGTCCDVLEPVPLIDSGGTGTADASVEVPEVHGICDCPVLTECCGNAVPSTLNWTISNVTGTCSCIEPDPGLTGTVAFNPALGVAGGWGTVTFECLVTECEENASYVLQCVDGTWDFNSGTLVSLVCDPFELVFDKTINGGSYRITFTAP